MAGITKRVQALEQFLAEGQVAGDGTRLDERHALPRLTGGGIVMLEPRERSHQRTVRALGPQAHVDPKQEPVGGLGLQHAGGGFGHLGVKFDIGEGARLAVLPAASLALVKINEIDVGGEIEFLPAQFAQAQHGKARRPVELLVPGLAVAPRPLLVGEPEAFAQAELTQAGQFLDRGEGGGETVDVAIGDPEGHLAPPAAQLAQPEFVGHGGLTGSGLERAPFIEQGLIAEISVAVLRLFEPVAVVGLLAQQLRVKRTGLGQARKARPCVRRECVGRPPRMVLEQPFAEASGRGGAGGRAHGGRDSAVAEDVARVVQQPLFLVRQRAETFAVDLVEDAVHFRAQVVAVGQIDGEVGGGLLPPAQPAGQLNAGAKRCPERVRPAGDTIIAIGGEHGGQVGDVTVPQGRRAAGRLIKKKADEIERHPAPAEELRLHCHRDDEEREERDLLVGVVAAIQRKDPGQGDGRPEEHPVNSEGIDGTPGQGPDRNETAIKPGEAPGAYQPPQIAAKEIKAQQVEY